MGINLLTKSFLLTRHLKILVLFLEIKSKSLFVEIKTVFKKNGEYTDFFQMTIWGKLFVKFKMEALENRFLLGGWAHLQFLLGKSKDISNNRKRFIDYLKRKNYLKFLRYSFTSKLSRNELVFFFILDAIKVYI